MWKEFDSLVEWQKDPKNKNIISGGWFFTIKSKINRGYELKACFIAKGYSQIYGKNYRETGLEYEIYVELSEGF